MKSILAIALFITLTPAVPGQDLNEELHAATRRGDFETVKSLLDRGADVNAKSRYGATPLSFAADRGNIEIVRLLLDRGAELNVKDTFYNATPITWAAMKGHVEIVRLLLAKGAEGKESVLMAGVGNGNIELVRAALEKGEFSDQILTTALVQAKMRDDPELARALEAAGAKAPPPANFNVDAETLAKYAGEYRNEQGLDIKISVRDGKLVGVAGGQQNLTLGAIDKTTFAPAEIPGLTIKFTMEDDRVTGLTVVQGEFTTSLKRVVPSPEN